MPYELSDFHFLLLHFPIALFITALIFDLLSYVTNNNTCETVGYSNMLLGVIFSIPTIIAGFITDMDVNHMSSLWPFYSTHGVVQITAALLFTVLCIIRYRYKPKYDKNKTSYLLFNILIVFLLMYGAHLGARLAGRI